ncbi:hypothetical protein A2U01_0102374, partial [Trifolium medium]|nr:hypothetical protein [Trifolium medium]
MNVVMVTPLRTPPVHVPYFQYPYVTSVAQGQYPQQAYPMPPPQRLQYQPTRPNYWGQT